MVCVKQKSGVFKSYKSVLIEVYSDVMPIRKYQVFDLKAIKPNGVSCFIAPDDEFEECDLRRRCDGIWTDATKLEVMSVRRLDQFFRPKSSDEMVQTVHTKVRPYISPKFVDDDMYAAPTNELQEASKSVKKWRFKYKVAAILAATEIVL